MSGCGHVAPPVMCEIHKVTGDWEFSAYIDVYFCMQIRNNATNERQIQMIGPNYLSDQSCDTGMLRCFVSSPIATLVPRCKKFPFKVRHSI